MQCTPSVCVQEAGGSLSAAACLIFMSLRRDAKDALKTADAVQKLLSQTVLRLFSVSQSEVRSGFWIGKISVLRRRSGRRRAARGNCLEAADSM